MDNIQEKIAEIMADPQAMSQVQSLGKMLGLGNNSQTNNIAPLPESTESNQISSEMMGKIMKIMPVLQQVNQEDDVSRLLQSLRPFLSEERCKKLDSAKKMLQMMKIIPLLKEGGLMDLGIF